MPYQNVGEVHIGAVTYFFDTVGNETMVTKEEGAARVFSALAG